MAFIPAKIPLEPVASTLVSGIGYDPTTQTLAVQLTSGPTYHAPNVDPAVVAGFKAAQSHGRFFNEHIRKHHSLILMTGECPKCGAKHGWIGETCSDCGCAEYAPSEKKRKTA